MEEKVNKTADMVAYTREYRAKNKERVRAYQRNYYAKNKKKRIAQSMAWAKKNEEAMKAYRKNYYEKNRVKLMKKRDITMATITKEQLFAELMQTKEDLANLEFAKCGLQVQILEMRDAIHGLQRAWENPKHRQTLLKGIPWVEFKVMDWNRFGKPTGEADYSCYIKNNPFKGDKYIGETDD